VSNSQENNEENVELTIDVSPEMVDVLARISSLTGDSESDVLRKAILLLDLAVETVHDGGTVTINESIGAGKPLVPKKITGLLGNRTGGAPNLAEALLPGAKG
jgi:hypothetical protein